MTIPQGSDADLHEQSLSVVDEPDPSVDELPEGASEADVAEQRAEVVLDDEDAPLSF